jgi:hypothetical protein
MALIETREQLFELLVNVEISPKEILKHEIKNKFVSTELNSMLKSYLIDDDYDRKAFNDDLQYLNSYVRRRL